MAFLNTPDPRDAGRQRLVAVGMPTTRRPPVLSHIAAALGLGGSESNLHNFQPFGGFADEVAVEDGFIHPPDAPGIGFETRSSLRGLFRSLAS
jgi:hypothetical protein